ncbi:MAG: LytTR family transcriptional regulator [Sphingobacteriia bacterium]|nr:LytTR family transcriptional regulator [Sphingobacteriia bacterium]
MKITDCFFLKTGRKYYEKIRVNDILYIESRATYSRLVTADKSYLVLLSLRNWLQVLPEDRFIRIHKSYIVHLEKITTVSSEAVHIHETVLPLNRSQRAYVLRQLPVIGPLHSLARIELLVAEE